MLPNACQPGTGSLTLKHTHTHTHNTYHYTLTLSHKGLGFCYRQQILKLGHHLKSSILSYML